VGVVGDFSCLHHLNGSFGGTVTRTMGLVYRRVADPDPAWLSIIFESLIRIRFGVISWSWPRLPTPSRRRYLEQRVRIRHGSAFL
jgi:hypothetical protein